MYRKILVALEHGRTDEALLAHVAELARRLGSELFLVHVADGFAARNFQQLQLAESEEMRADRAYLEATAGALRARGLTVDLELGLGSPPAEIVRLGEARHCDLLALASHGHGLVGDVFLGSTIDRVRHQTRIPLLVVGAARPR
jgi:manganese transport protein